MSNQFARVYEDPKNKSNKKNQGIRLNKPRHDTKQKSLASAPQVDPLEAHIAILREQLAYERERANREREEMTERLREACEREREQRERADRYALGVAELRRVTADFRKKL
ncbi:hypothetical protein CCP3SC15_430019 [Gammaproteobacteria bacterium]